MIKKIHIGIILIFMLLLTACGGEKIEIKNVETTETTTKVFIDKRDKEITIGETPKRIVSVSASVDEFLLSLTDESQVVGVSEEATNPAVSNVYKKAKKVENKLSKASVEQIVALKPDLVIVPSFEKIEFIEQIEAANIPVYQIDDQSSFEGIKENINEIGQMIGKEKEAKDYIASMNKRFKELKEKTDAIAEKDKVRVLYWSARQTTVLDNTLIGDRIRLSGAINVINEAGLPEETSKFPKLSKEKVVELNPDVIITTASVSNPEDRQFFEQWKQDPALKDVAAFKNNRIYFMEPPHFMRSSPYAIEGVFDLYDVLYEK